MKKMKKINFPLLVGSIILVFFIILCLWPHAFTNKDPICEEQASDIEYKVDGEWVKKFAYNPKQPNKENIFGTDDAGRDVYSRLVYGARNTFKLAFLIALFRMIIALPLGIAGGMGSKFTSSIIKVFNTFFTAIPMLIFGFVILNLQYFKYMPMKKSIISYAIVLTIIGWAKLAVIIEDSTRLVMEEDFVEGEIAIGKTKFQIAFQNILPHIIPTSASLFFKEMGMALFLIAQMAIIGVFVGAVRGINELAFKANYEMSLEPEWGSSLSRIAVDMSNFNSVYWTIIYPVLMFTISIIGINLFGEGLRIEFQKRDSRVMSSVRKILAIISPKAYIHQIRNVKRYYKPVIIKTLVIISIIIYAVVPWHPSKYKFDIDSAKSNVMELTSSKYEGRVTGSEGGYLAGEYIIDKLNSYGYKVDVGEIPINRNSVVDEFGNIYDNENIEGIEEKICPLAPTKIKSGTITLKDDNGNEKVFNLHKDFTIITVGGDIFQDESKKEITFEGIAADEEHKTDIPEGKSYFKIEKEEVNAFMAQDYNRISECELTFRNYEDYRRDSNAYIFNNTTILTFGELNKEMQKGYKEVKVEFDYPELAKHPGRNIKAFIPGKGKSYEDPGETIIIGATYDGIYSGYENQYALSATPAATLLEVARTLSEVDEPLEKSIELIFWDNDSEMCVYSTMDGSSYFDMIERKTIQMVWNNGGYYYFDIGYSGFNADKKFEVGTELAEGSKKRNYPMILELEKRLNQINAKYERINMSHNATKALWQLQLNANTTIEFQNMPSTDFNNDSDKIENINFRNMKDMGQIIIDTLTMNPNVMN